MKIVPKILRIAAGILLCLLIACHPTPDKGTKIGLVSAIGGFGDRGYSADILAGFAQSQTDYEFYGNTRTSYSEEQIRENIAVFLKENYDLIITYGIDAGPITVETARNYPGTDFVIIDYAIDNPPGNLLCVTFPIEQAAFPSGFLAAWWGNLKDSLNPLVGFVAGINSPAMRLFTESYTHGVTCFNGLYQKNVHVSGYYADSFTDTLQGARLADSLLNKGASVLFACAGKTGNGALYKVKDAGKWAIGVDVDQYHSIPDVGPVLLTSCMKLLSSTLYDIVRRYMNDSFDGGQVNTSGGVALAPYHAYEEAIPYSIRQAIDSLMNGIAAGTIRYSPR